MPQKQANTEVIEELEDLLFGLKVMRDKLNQEKPVELRRLLEIATQRVTTLINDCREREKQPTR
jgi:hypothetical protein